MNSNSRISHIGKLLMLSICVFAGAISSFAQDGAAGSGQLQQEIDRLQKLLELQQQMQQLQGQGQTLPQAPLQSQPQTGQAWGAAGNQSYQGQQQAVTLRPVDTGRSVVTFNLGGTLDRFAIKTNLLYAGATLTPNLGFEIGLGGRTSIELSGGYNNWHNLWDNAATGPDFDLNNNYKRRLDHIFGKIDFRYWFGERFDGHFLGAGVFYTDYNVGDMKVPLLFEREYDYNGNGFGGVISYGYLWRWSSHWAMEFSIGAGIAALEYDKSLIETDGDKYQLVQTLRYRKTYAGPISAGIKLVFTIK